MNARRLIGIGLILISILLAITFPYRKQILIWGDLSPISGS